MSVLERSRQGAIETLTLNRPEAYNALDDTMLIALRDAAVELASDPEVRVVVVTGAGKAFCSGGDLKYLQAAGDDVGAVVYDLAGVFHEMVLEFRRMPKPVLAAVNGIAAGGGFSLALACDIRVLDSGARMRLAYSAGGLSIDGGGTWTLPRLVGFSRGLDIALRDPMIDAKTAFEIGLVTELAEPGQALARTLEIAAELATRNPGSMANAKALFYSSPGAPLSAQLDEERRALARLLSTANGAEALASFVEKRPAKFRGAL